VALPTARRTTGAADLRIIGSTHGGLGGCMHARRHARTRRHPRLRRSSGRRRRAASSRHWRRSSRAPRALASTTGPGSLGHLAALRLQPGPPFGGTSTANRPLKWPGHSVCFRAGWEGGGADEAQSSPGAASLFSLVFVMQGHESESAGPGFVTRSVVTVRACGGPGTEAALPVQACHWQPALQPSVTGSPSGRLGHVISHGIYHTGWYIPPL
jgi:hypothetical protein